MNYSAQQLSGGARYTRAKTGNWFEDGSLAECKLNDFKKKEAEKSLVSDAITSKNSLCHRPVALSTSEGGTVKYGDVVVLLHTATQTSLACDLTEPLYESSIDMKLATTSTRREPVSRNTFRIQSPENKKTGELICYGEPLYLVSNENTAYLLASTLKNERIASRISNQQAVYLTTKPNHLTVWTFEKVSANPGVIRHLATNEPITIHTPLVIQHKATKEALAADTKFSEFTHFGTELELTCHNHYSKGKIEALVSESKGRTNTSTRLENAPNYWSVILQD